MTLPSRRAYHVIYDRSFEDALRYASENRWTGIVPDFNVPRFSPEHISTEERERLRGLSDSLSIEWGFHAPSDDISFFTTHTPIRAAILQYHQQIIDLARDISTHRTNLVLHAGTPPSFRKSGESIDAFTVEYHDIYLETLYDNLESLIQYGKSRVDIVLENQRWNNITLEAIEKLVPKGLGLCLDLPKLYDSEMTIRNIDWEIFNRYRDAIMVVHVHDWSTGGSHQVVGEGDIDFTETLEFLSTLKHEPLYVFEVRPREAAQKSLGAFSQLLDKHDIAL